MEVVDLRAPLPTEQVACWQEVSRRCRGALGPRTWLRRLPIGMGLEPTCEIGVAGPDDHFELRAQGATWSEALAGLHKRLFGEAP